MKTDRVNAITSRWWFYILVLMLVLIPPFASKGYSLHEILKVKADILLHPISPAFTVYYPIFNLIAMLFIASAFFVGRKVSAPFNLYAGASYLLFAVIQNVSISSEYGFGISVMNVALVVLVSASWFWDVVGRRNDFSPRRQPGWKYCILGLAFIAFWLPINPINKGPHFDPALILTSGSSLTFCAMTTVFLAILIYYFPNVNLTTLRVTSFVGLLIGLGNLWLEFLYLPALWWVGVLHLPLVVIAIVGLILSWRQVLWNST